MAIKKLKIAPKPLEVPEGISSLPMPVICFQKSTGETWANPTFESEFGRATAARFQAKTGLKLVQDRKLETSVFSMPGRHEGYHLERASGSSVPVEVKVTPYGDESFIVIVDDVSAKVDLEKQLIQNHLELKRTQEALVQSAKLASLGELSSGIAHELNQPLQAIMGFSQELEHVESLSTTGKEFIHDIVSASRKMAEIIKSLRSFARESGDQMTDVNVEVAVREAMKLTHHSLMQHSIDVKLQCPEHLTAITANSIQVEQVFINLISNARDAITTANPTRGTIQISLTEEKGWICVRVKDNGSGMTDEVKSRIFDPFFTTKEVGQGTGLGLSITYGILKKIGAQIDVKSAPKVGTEFILRFKTKGEPS